MFAYIRVETERQKHRSRAFRALKFSIRAISSTIFDFEFSIRAISSGKMVEHFEHGKMSSDHRAISSISLEKFFEQNRAFFERNRAFFERNRAFFEQSQVFLSMVELTLLSKSTSGKFFNWFENYYMNFEQKCEKHIFLTFSQPKNCQHFQFFLVEF